MPCCHRAHFAVLSRRPFFCFVVVATICGNYCIQNPVSLLIVSWKRKHRFHFLVRRQKAMSVRSEVNDHMGARFLYLKRSYRVEPEKAWLPVAFHLNRELSLLIPLFTTIIVFACAVFFCCCHITLFCASPRHTTRNTPSNLQA